MKKTILMVCVCCAAVAAVGCGQSQEVTETAIVAEAVPAEVVAEDVAVARHDVLYVCNCGPECDCGSVSAEAGTCTCGTELVPAHMVKVEGNEALLCSCGADCTCEIDAEDESKCACGKDIRRVNLEGSGIYYCNCGGACTCNYASNGPGTCDCGMELITS